MAIPENANGDELLAGVNRVKKGKLYFSRDTAQTFQQNKTDEGPVLTERKPDMVILMGED